MSVTALGDRIRGVICEELAFEPDEVGDGAPLFSTGMVDSFTFVAIVSLVEAELGWQLDPGTITLDNFDSIDRILAFVARERAASSPV